ncbi:hypothetical protein [Brevibacillus laterosporus]|uniref:hypothetical protein n=1 Tax=Brevibacillus laterosporus TaxID=1465 RepID=UPI001EF214D0|nr:hypothetical protein [Brevibacillus laterosporus]MCG7320197.1 hypothetical protein [Brevibacillus laterosporus]
MDTKQWVPIRKVRSDKKIRVNPSLNTDTHGKLEKLALSCEMTKTKLAEEILKLSLNSPDIVRYLQTKYNKNPRHKINPVIVDKRVEYMYFD